MKSVTINVYVKAARSFSCFEFSTTKIIKYK